MLTPNDISNKKFEKAAFGYKTEDVETFMTDLALSYTRLYQDNSVSEEKLEVLAEKLEEYRANEDSLRTVLIGAQKLGDSIIRDSKGKAEVIISEAEKTAKQIIYESEKQIKAEQSELERIQRETTDFKKRLLAMYKQHLELITAMPESVASDRMARSEYIPEQPTPVEVERTEPEPAYDDVTMAETKEISFPPVQE